MSYLYTMLENQDEISEELAEAIEKTDDFADVDTGETIALEATLEELDVAINVTSDQIAEGEKVEQEIAAPAEAVAESGEPMPMDEAPSAEGPDGTTQETRVLTHREAVLIGKRMKAIAAMSREQHLPSITQLSNETSGKFGYTMQALEGVRATIKRWWEKFKAFVKKYVEKAIELFEKYVGEVARLARAAKKLSEKAANTSGSKGENIKLSTSQYKAMCLSTKADAAKITDNLSKAVTKLKGSELSVSNKIKHMKDAERETRKLIDKATSDADIVLPKFVDSGFKDIYGIPLTVRAGYINTFEGETINVGLNLESGKPWFGGKDYIVELVPLGDQSSYIATYQTAVASDLKIKEDDELPALTPSQVSELCKSIVQVCDGLLESFKQARQMKDILKATEIEGDKRIAKIEKLIKGDGFTNKSVTYVRNAVKLHMDMDRFQVRGVKDSNQALLTAAKAAYNYANRSLSAVEKD